MPDDAPENQLRGSALTSGPVGEAQAIVPDCGVIAQLDLTRVLCAIHLGETRMLFYVLRGNLYAVRRYFGETFPLPRLSNAGDALPKLI